MITSSDPRLPKDPAEYRPRTLMGAGFWALMIFGVACILAGVAIALFGPRLLPVKLTPEALTPPNRVEGLTLPSVPEPLAAPEASTGEVKRLTARIAELESRGARSIQATAAALATTVLMEASQSSRPFASELDVLRAAAPNLPEISTMATVAATGAPSRAALAVSFPDYAGHAANAARRPQEGASLRARFIYALSNIVRLRRVEDLTGSGPDALIARAERALEDGDVNTALRLLDQLPPPSRQALKVWRAGA